MENNFDLIIIGAGPGGYVSAIKAAKLGLKTAIIENAEIGGTCLNRGCIPTKAMLHASSLFREFKDGAQFGITASDIKADYGKILEYKEETVHNLVSGITQLLKANGVTFITGHGVLMPENNVFVTSNDGEITYHAENVILAAGSVPTRIPVPGIDLPGVLTSDELFNLDHLPESLVIIGGGVIGVEFAEILSALGCKITIVEALPRLLANLDKEISQNLKLILKKRGVDIHTSASLVKIEQDGENYSCTFSEKEKELQVSSQYILCAAGRKPNTSGLFDPAVNIKTEHGFIDVDEHFETSINGVFAIGDIIKGMQLAHTASAQGYATAEYIAGVPSETDLSVVPSCIYTNPEISSVGITEEYARENDISVNTGKIIMSTNGKSIISKEERGFIKVITDKNSDVVLGAQMMCARATDMIGEFATAIANKLTSAQLMKAMRAHPTYNEAVAEALEELHGGAIHTVPKKKKPARIVK